MTSEREELAAALAEAARGDVAELLAEVRREARRRAHERLVEAYADALVAAVLQQPQHAPSSTSSSAASPTGGHGETGCYVYAVVSGDGTGVAGMEGIQPGEDVGVVSLGDISAIVSIVDVDEMRTEGARLDIADDGWLARAVRVHERVACAAFRSAPTIPMRFGVVHPTRDAVQQLLQEHGDNFRQELQRLEGAAEWGVKVYADRNRLAAHITAGRDSDGSVAGGGRGYLLRERARRTVDQEIRGFVASKLDELSGSLATLARDAAVGPTPAGAGEAPVFSGFYLVAPGDESRLAETVDGFTREFGPAGLTAEAAGPWPPYHFTTLRLEAHRA